MSSEYLGWRERDPPRDFDTSRFDRNIMPGGPVTQGFESYVKSIFRPTSSYNPECPTQLAPKSQHTDLPMGASTLSGDPKVSAASLLKMEQYLGKDALDDSNDHNLFDADPLIGIYSELGYRLPSHNSYRQYPVYTPKSSSEYHSIRSSLPNPANVRGDYRGSFHSYKPREESWRTNDRQTLIDYKDFDSSPLSPYLYRDHQYVRNQDSRIVGSNFVQLTTRPRDSFLDKIDKTLAEVRAMPRYC